MERTSPTPADRVAARDAVVRLAQAWGLELDDACALVDLGRVEWELWVTGMGTPPSDGQLARIGALLAIYADIHAVFSGDLADQWVSRPNSNDLFDGRTPLQAMVDGGMPAMIAVLELLDSRRYT